MEEKSLSKIEKERETVAGPSVEAVGDSEVEVGGEPDALYKDGAFGFGVLDGEVHLETGVPDRRLHGKYPRLRPNCKRNGI